MKHTRSDLVYKRAAPGAYHIYQNGAYIGFVRKTGLGSKPWRNSKGKDYTSLIKAAEALATNRNNPMTRKKNPRRRTRASRARVRDTILPRDVEAVTYTAMESLENTASKLGFRKVESASLGGGYSQYRWEDVNGNSISYGMLHLPKGLVLSRIGGQKGAKIVNTRTEPNKANILDGRTFNKYKRDVSTGLGKIFKMLQGYKKPAGRMPPRRRGNPPSSEMAMQGLHDKGLFRLPRVRRRKKNSAVDISGNPCNPRPRRQRFRDLAIGDKFIFTSEIDYPYSGIAQGPWVKVSSKKYKHYRTKGYYTVGSTSAEVIRRGRATRKDMESNPEHFPRTTRGRKGNSKWFIFDIYGANGKKIGTQIGKGTLAESRRKAASLSTGKVRNKNVTKVVLSGPYASKPKASTKRK